MRILGIAGSLRAGSYNRRLLGLAGTSLPTGVELVVWEGLRDVPPFDEDDEGEVRLGGGAARQQRARGGCRAVRDAGVQRLDSGALKNALDWASRPVATTSSAGSPWP